MDLNIQLPTNPTERRRLQNRIAQRKFRQKRDQRQSASTNTDVPALPVVDQAPVLSNAESSTPSFSNFSFPPADPSDEARSINPNLEDLVFAGISEPENFSDTFSGDDHLMRLLSGITDDPSVQANTGINPLPAAIPSDLGTTANVVSDGTIILDINNLGGNITKSLTPWLDNQLNPAPYSNAKPPHIGTLSPLHIAAQKGSDKILRVLLQHHSNSNEKDSDGRTPLMHATMYDHPTSVQILLAQGARIGDVDNENRSCLHWAVLYRRRSVLEVLLDHYSQHNAPLELDINAYDDAGWTPLHMAIYHDFEAGVVLLLKHGANVDTKARKCPYASKPSPAPPS